MTSYLIEFVLLAALVFTAWRTGTMYRELRRLRDGERGLGEALAAADQSINKAAHAVVVLKHEGVQTLRALEARNEEARALAERLADLVERADRHCGNVAASGRPASAVRQTGEIRRIPASHQPRIVGQSEAVAAGAALATA